MKRKILLLIMDGVGVAPRSNGNAVALSNPVNLTRMWESNPHTYLEASSEEVGLAENTNGNSEVGHLTIGAGKINYQNLLKINNAIEKGAFFENQTLKQILSHAQQYGSTIHIMGCLSDGAVHSHIKHLFAVLEFLKRNNFKGKVLLHIFTDGRDTPPKSAHIYLQQLSEYIEKVNIGQIATICGRAYAMDRNNILKRTQMAYDLLVWGKARIARSWQECIQIAYNEGEIDEYIKPTKIVDNSTIQDNDAVLFLNFRPDRSIQLTKALKNMINGEFQSKKLENMFFAGMVEYEKDFPAKVLFPKEYIALPIGRIISDAGYRQLRIAESEKFPHVTYFMNGGLPVQYAGEDRIKIPSPTVATYDTKPEMSALEVLNALTSKLNSKNNYQFIVVNLANADMVGHTGNIQASIKAMQIIDYVTEKIVQSALSYGWTIIITSDHGNVERMIDEKTQQSITEHTQNPVPFMIIHQKSQISYRQKLPHGSLCDIAPTILKLIGIEKPAVMTGKVLIA